MGNSCKNYSTVVSDQPLIIAIKEGNKKRVKKVLKEWEKKGGTLTRAFAEAAQHNSKDIIGYFLTRVNIDCINSTGRTSLIEAVLAKQRIGVTVLLECRADPNVCDPVTGNSPLILAAEIGHHEILQILIERGAQVNYINPNRGITALMVGCQQGHERVVEILCTLPSCDIEVLNAKCQNSLMFACTYGNIKVVTLLLDRGCKVDIADEDGATAFIKAAAHGHLDIVKQLINKKCRTNVTDKTGRNALDLAQASQHTEVVEFLRSVLEDKIIDMYVVEIVAESSEQAVDNEKCIPGEIEDHKVDIDSASCDMTSTDFKLDIKDGRHIDIQDGRYIAVNEIPADQAEEIKVSTFGYKDCGYENCQSSEANPGDVPDRSRCRKHNPIKARTYPRRTISKLTKIEHSCSSTPSNEAERNFLTPVDLTDAKGENGQLSSVDNNARRRKNPNHGIKAKKKVKIHCNKIVIGSAINVYINSLTASKDHLLTDHSYPSDSDNTENQS